MTENLTHTVKIIHQVKACDIQLSHIIIFHDLYRAADPKRNIYIINIYKVLVYGERLLTDTLTDICFPTANSWVLSEHQEPA